MFIGALISAVIIGVSLGLIGGGGSILTVPVFVYMLGISPVIATAYSLFVVGSTSLVGSVAFMRKGLVNYKAAVVFAIPSFISVYLTRMYIIPAIPEKLFSIGELVVTKDIAIMVFFALIMFAAAISMIKKKKGLDKQDGVPEELKFNLPLIALEGAFVGVLTGIVGAGGGFLIIPALVLFARLPMKMAVGTSLLIISAKSLIGFIGDIQNQPIDWEFLLMFTGISIVGIILGSILSKKISGEKLKAGFGYFVLIMAVYILVSEFINAS
ncbi:sulfite exporter TauE/SafE family protein [Mangrovivirga cuniculi]|uniref:Probable membrane transporter protein n=1 Tax=Mangrovivirga cuniculi TaxID=2715131 RepID=A0A4D7JL49_9BACT|nr:sulfite exporter TauE/SafE family protein [Mangrovivirga cuniculi]QCK14230.1 permease [Mangrovivirga cuniculi]